MTRVRIAESSASDAIINLAAEYELGKVPVPLAWTSQARSSGAQVEVAWLPAARQRGDERIDLQALEYLYHAILQMDPLARYTFRGALSADTKFGRLDHMSALAVIAAKRNCIAADLASRDQLTSFLKWESVRMNAVASNLGLLNVAVIVRDALNQPVTAAQVSFARGSHFTCSAATDKDGMARCTMWDAHGHVDATDDDARAPTVANFGGVVTSERIKLPTTYTWDRSNVGRKALWMRQR